MSICKCTILKHTNHSDRRCINLGTKSGKFCMVCHDKSLFAHKVNTLIKADKS